MMKTIFNNQIMQLVSPLILVGCILFSTAAPVNAQKKERTRLKAYYEKLPNNNKKISIILTQGKGKSISGVQNSEVIVSTVAADSTLELATLITDSQGETALYVEPDYSFPKNEEGYVVINVNYNGNDSLRASKRKIEFLDLNLEVSLNIIDSVKYVEVEAFELDNEGNKLPIEEIDVNMGVKRLYNTLFLEEAETDEEGIASMEFPDNIPGDSSGMITVVVKLDEHDDYGTITKTADIDWGTAVDYSIASNDRSLFGDSAPLWMIISVAVILFGAWFNFLLAVYKVYQIKKLAND